MEVIYEYCSVVVGRSVKIGRNDVDYMDCSMEEDMEMASAIARKYEITF